MTSEQLDVLRVSDPAQARALRGDIELLGRFLSPASPSDVAVTLGQPANLVHHHARKLMEFGLLREVRREGGKMFLQLVAREFRFPFALLPPLDGEGKDALVQALTSTFLRAYGRAWRQSHEGDEEIVGFGDRERPAPLPPLPTHPAQESHPPHLDALSLRLSRERYRSLVQAISALLDEAAAEGRQDLGGDRGEVCTVTLLASRGALQHDPAHFRGVSRDVSSFLGADPG
ncbi:transcriptional regulator (plasmid) [Deinococcus aetherius]|uniref:Transcriptional regulator n=1 Tax=Deinococcus aetherius TaxID=200252 RepID=A0ABN6RKU4_9DEIO|nr:hypothetical protein [Deinococcus aetherius]BDP43470.1 transcriptional regulator [Deinococcus aetherius]